jgi:hypothetical protein
MAKMSDDDHGRLIGEGPFIVVTGQIADGFEFTGPFGDYDDACAWAGELGEAWWIEPLHLPNEEETSE